MCYRDLIGTKFKAHGRSVQEGFDCYGLAIEVLSRNGIRIPDVFYEELPSDSSVSDKIHEAVSYKSVDKAVENCLIEFNIKGEPTHVGVYIGGGLFIHCRIGIGVVIEPLYRWKSKVMGYYIVKG